jgi:hypothetical protein
LTITAVFSGDDNYNPSSGNLTVVVPQLQTTVLLDAFPSADTPDITLVAIVPGLPSDPLGSQAGGAGAGKAPPVPTGTVTFFDGGVPLGKVPVQAGSGTLVVGRLTPGPHDFTAEYSGDSFYAAARSADLSLTGDPVPAPTPSQDPGPNAAPSGPHDVTGLVSITLGKVRRRRGRFQQKVTLRNHGTSSISGPVVLVLQGLSRRITLLSGRGTARVTRAAGNANAVLVLDAVATFLPSQSVTVDLAFRGRKPGGLRFTPQVLAGAGLV